jgi:glycosyltransferase involved in cell wall biosynthesis
MAAPLTNNAAPPVHTQAQNPKDLRVALLTNSLSPHSLPLWECLSTGVKQFRALVSAGFDLQHKFPKATTHLDVKLQRSFNRFRFHNKPYGTWESDDFHLPYDTYHQLNAYRPDVIISGQFGLRTLLSVLYGLTHPGVKVILWATLSCRSERYRGWHRVLLRKWILKRISGAFVNGKSGEEYLRRLGYTGPLAHIPYSIDGTLFHIEHYAPQPGHFRLLFTGRLVPQKGLRTFCTILDLWCGDHPETTVRIRFVGEGREEEFLRTMPTHPNLTIELVSKVTQQQLRAHYQESDIFALPTLSDEWAVVTNEAMNAGLPVLGSIQAQSVDELVKEGDNGWRFDLLSEADTYRGFDHAFSTTIEQLQVMSLKARETAAAFAPPRIAERALRFIESLYLSEPEQPIHDSKEITAHASRDTGLRALSS